MKLTYEAPEVQVAFFASRQNIATDSLEKDLLGTIVEPVEPSAGTDIDIDLDL